MEDVHFVRDSHILVKHPFFPPSDQRGGVAPLFEAQLDLRVPDMVFNPSLEYGAADGFYDLVESLVNDIYRTSSLVPRLAAHCSVPHYQVLHHYHGCKIQITFPTFPGMT